MINNLIINIIINIIFNILWFLISLMILYKKNIKQIAFNNALKIILLEKKINIFYEEKIQKYILNNYNIVFKVLNFIYLPKHYISMVSLIIYIIFYNNLINNKINMIFIIGHSCALFIYYVFPLMPPRLLNDPFYSSNDNTIVCSFRKNSITLFNTDIEKSINNYGSMPSLHFFDSLWFAHSLFTILKTNQYKYLFFIHPIITISTIIVTGHHYFMDIIISFIIYICLYKII